MIPLTHWETVLSRQEQFGPAFVTLIRCSAARRRVYVVAFTSSRLRYGATAYPAGGGGILEKKN